MKKKSSENNSDICTTGLTKEEIIMARKGKCISCGRGLNEPGFEHSIDAGAVRCNDCIRSIASQKKRSQSDLSTFIRILTDI